MAGVPIIKESINFSIGFEDVKWGDEEDIARRYAFVKEFTAPFKIKCGFAGQGLVSFDHPHIEKFLDALGDYINSHNTVFKDNCAYIQQYEGESEWYKYLPTKSIETTEYDGYFMTCIGANIPPNVHIGCGWGAFPFVSEKFKKVVEENNLTGLEFLWCKDVGRFAPQQQWYKAIATNFIGRGIDAPWVNVGSQDLLNSIKYPKYPNNLGRMAVTSFPAVCLQKDAQLPPRLKRYLSMCDINRFNITFHERFLRKYLPNTDFAFGYFPGWQGFYITKKAKDILFSNHFLNEEDSLEPVVILNELPEEAILIDGNVPAPDFNYGSKKDIGQLSFEELKNLHQQAKEAYDKITKPQKKITIKQALKLVNSEKRKRLEDFNRRISDKELKECTQLLPSNWIDLLKKTNGGYLSLECLLVPLKDIAAFTAEKLKQGKEFYEDYPENRISVAERGDGDWYDLKLSDNYSIDCPVVQVTHEGGDVVREWEDIATFVYDMILEHKE
ncbi:MAG: SMI1/KNR4 family protein [Bacillota bacterium]